MKKNILLLLLILSCLSLSAVTIQEIQTSDDGVSPYENQEVSVTGIVTATNYFEQPGNFFIQDENGGAWSGILVYSASETVSIGDEVEVTGTVVEYYDLTEISGYENDLTVTILSSNNPVPEPILLTTNEVNQEMYESVFVKIEDANIVTSISDYNEFDIDDGSGSCQVDDAFVNLEDANFVLDMGTTFTFIQGIVGYGYGEYELLPRSSNDAAQSGVLQADFTVTEYSGVAPFTVHFQSISVGEIASWEWDFDLDGIIDSVDENPTFTYSQVGDYSVSLTISDGENEDEKSYIDLLHVYESGAFENIRVMSYNTLYFGDDSEDRLSYFQTTIDYVEPDVILLQEVSSEEGSEDFLAGMQTIFSDYQAAEYINGPGGPDCWILFRSSMINLEETYPIATVGRNIMRYRLSMLGNPIYLYSCHLKAGPDSEEQMQRVQEVEVLAENIQDLPADSYYIIAGDMNIYTDQEEAYEILADNAIDFCPLIGEWHDNMTYTSVHTQSTRDSQFGGGSYGGMDDRFDFILGSPTLTQRNSIQYVEDSYTTIGQDGNHFNDAVNDGTNDVVSQTIANALYYASDHLPVIIDLNVEGEVENEIPNAVGNSFLKAYPNPFYRQQARSNMTVSFTLARASTGSIQLYNTKGQLVHKIEKNRFSAGKNSVQFSMKKTLPAGVYFIAVKTQKESKFSKILIMK